MSKSPFIMLDDKNKTLPLYRQIYESIRTAILNGEFVSKVRLPSSRDLANQLGVSRITVINAYEQLFAEGYLEGKTGSGTFVATKLPDDLLQTVNITSQGKEIGENIAPHLSPFGEKILLHKPVNAQLEFVPKFLPFQNGLTAIDKFPFEIWSKIAARFHKNPPRSILGYGNPQGYLQLRQAIATHLKSARGVNCQAEQIIITSGAQQALDLTARIFLSEKDTFLLEDPCYLEARNLFALTGAQSVQITVDDEGFNPAEIPKTCKNAKLIYVTPSHQFPLGSTMSLSRRLALIDWAKQHQAWIIEDDYNSEFRYSGRPLASLQGLDTAGRVIYIGTFSKTIFPGLRIGCVVAPAELVDVFTTARALNDVHSSTIEQAILAEFIAEGHFARHLRRMRTLYDERQQILVEECEKELSNLLEVKKADAGMHLVGWLPANMDDQAISQKAQDKGLIISPVSIYTAKKLARGGLILGYTAFDKIQIKEGVRKLSRILTKKSSFY